MAPDKPVYKKEGCNTHLNLPNRNHLSQGDRARNSRTTTTQEKKKKKKEWQQPFNSSLDFSAAVVHYKTWQLVSGGLVSDDTTLVQTLPRLFFPPSRLASCLPCFPLPAWQHPEQTRSQMCSRIFQSQFRPTERECGCYHPPLSLNTVTALFSYVAKGEDRVCVCGGGGGQK